MDKQLKLALVLALFSIAVVAQLPEDDEVLTAIPGYNHPIYSGIS